MSEVIRVAEENEVTVVFAQPEFSTRAAEPIAAEIGGQVILISPLEEAWLSNLRRVVETFAEHLAATSSSAAAGRVSRGRGMDGRLSGLPGLRWLPW